MACHKSAQKCIRKTIRQTAVNKSRMSKIRTFVKKALDILSKSSDTNERQQAFVNAESQLMKGVNKGVIHKNTAARKVSRLAKRLNSTSA